MEILLTQLEKKIAHLLTENTRLREQISTLQAQKNSIEEEQEVLKTKNTELGEQAKQLETQLQAVEGRLFHLVSAVATGEQAAVSLHEDTSLDDANATEEAPSEHNESDPQEPSAQVDDSFGAVRSTHDTDASMHDDIFTATSNTQDDNSIGDDNSVKNDAVSSQHY